MAAVCGNTRSVKVILSNAQTPFELDHQTMLEAVEGAVMKKSVDVIEAFTMSKYPIFFNLKLAKESLPPLAVKYKVDTTDPIFNDIRSALDVGAAILVKYKTDATTNILHCLSSVPQFPGVLHRLVLQYSEL